MSTLKCAFDELADNQHYLVLTTDSGETIQRQGVNIEVVNIIDWLLFQD